jgi:hypothetical protein
MPPGWDEPLLYPEAQLEHLEKSLSIQKLSDQRLSTWHVRIMLDPAPTNGLEVDGTPSTVLLVLRLNSSNGLSSTTHPSLIA